MAETKYGMRLTADQATPDATVTTTNESSHDSICDMGQHDLEDIGNNGWRCRLCGEIRAASDIEVQAPASVRSLGDDDGSSTIVSVDEGDANSHEHQQRVIDAVERRAARPAEQDLRPSTAFTPEPGGAPSPASTTSTAAAWAELPRALGESEMQNISRNF